MLKLVHGPFLLKNVLAAAPLEPQLADIVRNFSQGLRASSTLRFYVQNIWLKEVAQALGQSDYPAQLFWYEFLLLVLNHVPVSPKDDVGHSLQSNALRNAL